MVQTRKMSFQGCFLKSRWSLDNSSSWEQTVKLLISSRCSFSRPRSRECFWDCSVAGEGHHCMGHEVIQTAWQRFAYGDLSAKASYIVNETHEAATNICFQHLVLPWFSINPWQQLDMWLLPMKYVMSIMINVCHCCFHKLFIYQIYKA